MQHDRIEVVLQRADGRVIRIVPVDQVRLVAVGVLDELDELGSISHQGWEGEEVWLCERENLEGSFERPTVAPPHLDPRGLKQAVARWRVVHGDGESRDTVHPPLSRFESCLPCLVVPRGVAVIRQANWVAETPLSLS